MTNDFQFTEGSGKTGAAIDIGSGRLAPLVIVTEQDGSNTALAAKLGALTETAPATDTASSGLNGRLQRIAQRLTSLIALLPAALTGSGNFKVSLQESNASQAATIVDGGSVTLGSKADAKSTATDTTAITIMSVLKQVSASVQAIATSIAGTLTIGLPSGASTSANQSTEITNLGGVTETAPASDTASSGLNGRLQRIAQRLTTLIGSTIAVSGTFWQATQPVSQADGVNVTFGAKADAKSTATDTTAITAMSVWKQISASVQAIATSIAGTLTVATHAVTQSGTWTVQPGNTANTTAWKVDGSAVTQPVSIATNTPVGNVAHDGVDSGAPIKVGGRARSSEIAAVSSDDRSDFVTDLTGKQIVLPYANPENFVSGAITSAMTGTTSTSLIAAPASGLRNYITTIVVSNSHATVGTDIAIQDGSGGTTLMTIPAASVYGGAVINLPVPLRQPTTATAIYCANVTTGASTKVSAVGYKGA
jgi:hypothetical protein